jgi:hypothetical protein
MFVFLSFFFKILKMKKDSVKKSEMYIKSPTENGILEKNNSCIGFIF